MNIQFILILAALAGEAAAAAPPERLGGGYQAGESCPPAHGRSAERVQNLLSSPLLPEMRARYNLGTASASDVQLLTDPRDRDTCRLLWEAMHAAQTGLEAGDRISFYRSGDTFFVPITRSRRPARPGVVQLDGYSSLDVYDSTFTLVGRFGA